jgi:hypothetical protein
VVLLGLTGLVLAHLALTDIHHDREPDLATEWTVVRASLLAAGFALLVLGLALRGPSSRPSR